jgi:hypothetical protein
VVSRARCPLADPHDSPLLDQARSPPCGHPLGRLVSLPHFLPHSPAVIPPASRALGRPCNPAPHHRYSPPLLLVHNLLANLRCNHSLSRRLSRPQSRLRSPAVALLELPLCNRLHYPLVNRPVNPHRSRRRLRHVSPPLLPPHSPRHIHLGSLALTPQGSRLDIPLIGLLLSPLADPRHRRRGHRHVSRLPFLPHSPQCARPGSRALALLELPRDNRQ